MYVRICNVLPFLKCGCINFGTPCKYIYKDSRLGFKVILSKRVNNIYLLLLYWRRPAIRIAGWTDVAGEYALIFLSESIPYALS